MPVLNFVLGAVHKLRKHFLGWRGSQNAYRCLPGGGGSISNAYVSILKETSFEIETKNVFKSAITSHVSMYDV